ncbi:hypothetical protein [Halopenitus persicus]|uniref:hypothetical protein n=1 Tax=Halopenitus persicus TaxID=1048396 RepID=UPI0012FDEBBD|nr:hypothetical protein [Halopenitus persicus]
MSETQHTSTEPTEKKIERDVRHARSRMIATVQTLLADEYEFDIVTPDDTHLHATMERAVAPGTSDITVLRAQEVHDRRIAAILWAWKYSDDTALLKADFGGNSEVMYVTADADLITTALGHLVVTNDEWGVEYDADGDLPNQ